MSEVNAATETGATAPEGAPEAPDSTRERSTIEFPYGDLDSAVRIAKGVHEVGGMNCGDVQLAAHLGLAREGGGYRGLIRTAKVFKLITPRKGDNRLTDLGSRISDPQHEAAARAQAFLAVPLYNAIYERYKGRALPPPAALENEMATLGVAKKSASKARQPFQRSAKQAGFFAYGENRLVAPHGSQSSSKPSNDDRSDPVKQDDQVKPPLGGNGGAESRHELIEGLFKALPREQTDWSMSDRYKWLQAANTIFDLIYKNPESASYLKIEILESTS